MLANLPEQPSADDVRSLAAAFLRSSGSLSSFPELSTCKPRVVPSLVSYSLNAESPADARVLALECLRILCRERTHLDALQSETSLRALAAVAGLASPSAALSDVSREALCVLINATHSQPDAQARLWDTNGGDMLEHLIARIASGFDGAPDDAFLHVRLLFLAAVSAPEDRNPRLASASPALAKLADSLSSTDAFSPNTAKNSTLNSSDIQALSECFRCLSVIAMRAPSAITDAWLDPLSRVLSTSAAAAAQPFAVNAAIYAPLSFLALIGARVPSDALLSLLSSTIADDEALLPMVMLLRRLSLAHPATRRALKEAVLPAGADPAVRPESAAGLKGALVGRITAAGSAYAVKREIEDFLFVLCRHKSTSVKRGLKRY